MLNRDHGKTEFRQGSTDRSIPTLEGLFLVTIYQNSLETSFRKIKTKDNNTRCEEENEGIMEQFQWATPDGRKEKRK